MHRGGLAPKRPRARGAIARRDDERCERDDEAAEDDLDAGSD
jgi:hypothetical protein